jgi:hypothetical protein
MDNTRTIQVYIIERPDVEGIWVPVNSLLDVKQEDRFRMFEDDGTPVVWDGETEFTATSDPFVNSDGINAIEATRDGLIKDDFAISCKYEEV